MSAQPERLDDYRLARASDLLQQQQQEEDDVESSSCSSATDRFDAALTPLEVRAGKRLSGTGRVECRAAFDEDPLGFERIAEELAHRRGIYSPLGVLIRAVRDGDHRQGPPTMSDDDESARRLRRRMAERGIE